MTTNTDILALIDTLEESLVVATCDERRHARNERLRALALGKRIALAAVLESVTGVSAQSLLERTDALDDEGVRAFECRELTLI